MQISPYGTWPSPLSPAVMGGARVSLAGLQVVGDTCWWSESRPDEGGRMAVMRLPRGGTPEEISPPGVSVRSLVHGYGGGAHHVDGDALLYTDQDSQALWWLDPGADPVRLTPPAPDGEIHRYADARPVPGSSLVVSLRERHHGEDHRVVDDELVAVDRRARGALPTVLESGRDFYAAPRPSPDGRRLAWLAWDHPNMPWDGTELWVADLDLSGLIAAELDSAELDGAGRPRLVDATMVAGGPDRSVGQPTWADADLWFVSDQYGWWQPFRVRPGHAPQRMATDEAEFAAADWALGQTSIDPGPTGALVCRIRRRGVDVLALADRGADDSGSDGGSDGASDAGGVVREVAQPCVTIAAVSDSSGSHGPEVVLMGSPATAPAALYRVPVGPGPVAEPDVIYRPLAAPLDPDWVAVPEPLTFSTMEGSRATLLFFAPHAPGWSAPAGTLPPLVVTCHGGPTAGVEPGFDAAVQLWTTRGVAVALVDYRGSTGHGRRFRRLLDGAWGVADAEDCRSAAAFLADSGLVDGDRMVAKGSSAGGLTALRCLDSGGPFAAAVVSYGVTDLAALAADTHKFESRYTDRLIGPWPQAAALYDERSPARHPERVEGAVLLLQGADDPIVPPDQAERMVAALRARGVRCDHVVFPGEGHGFRRAETLTRCAELELAFVGDVLGFAPSAATASVAGTTS